MFYTHGARHNLQGGQAVLTAVVFFLFISTALIFGYVTPVIKETKIAKDLVVSKKSYLLAESGQEDIVYRIRNAKQYQDNYSLTIDGSSAAINVVSFGDIKTVLSNASNAGDVRKVSISLAVDLAGAAFNYGVQVGAGGLIMENTSSVTGNVYSNGPIHGYNSNLIRGSAVSADAGGLINGSHATGTAYAHSITDSQVDGDAYYQSISGTTVVGTKYPGSADQPPKSFPISDATIAGLEQSATTTVINSPCPYTIETNTTIGPAKINCTLKIKGDPTVTLTGNIWVAGNLEIENTAKIKIDPSLGRRSVAIIVDNPTNRITSSKVELENSAVFQNSGTVGSYVMVISMNNSAESGGSEDAVSVANSISGTVLVYAPHGEIHLKNSASLKEATAYRMRLSNSANVIYESGLANIVFDAGPSGSFSITDWLEVF